MRALRFKPILFFVALLLVSFAPTEWKVFESKPDGFKAEFPGAATPSTQKVPSAIGELVMNIFSFQPTAKSFDDNLIYMIIETDYPADQIHSDDTAMRATLFRNAIDGGVASAKGKLISETDITLGKYHGREIKVEINNDEGKGNKGYLHSRFFFVENKMFIIQVLTSKSKDVNASIKRFWDSFALL